MNQPLLITIVEITEDIAVFSEGQVSKWDKGERFIIRTAENKRHGEGSYPERLISLTDGSMFAWQIIVDLEKDLHKKFTKIIFTGSNLDL